MFRVVAAQTVKRSFVRRLATSKTYAKSPQGARNLVPYYTVGACAATSGAMYMYFSQKLHNESSEQVTEDVPVVVVEETVVDKKSGEVVAEVVEEFVVDEKSGEVVAEVVVEETPAVADEETLVEAVAEVAEEEAAQQGAYNEETGEINWDCPCLGGMAEGPCGEEFKAAFSCFIYSKEEPKGIECIDKFKDMQNCFRKYPEVYSDELRDEEELAAATGQAEMNKDIVESVHEAAEEAKQIGAKIAKPAIDLYGAAQKKIDDFNRK